MFSCKQFVVNESFPGLPQLFTSKVPTRLLGSSFGEECGKLFSHSDAKEASELIKSESVVFEKSVLMQQSSALFLCNATEMSKINSTKSEDQNVAKVVLVQEKHVCDECEISECSLCDKKSNWCADVNTFSDFATCNSMTCSPCEVPPKNISERCGVPFEELFMTTNPVGIHVMENDIESVNASSVVKHTEVVVEGKDVLDGIEIGSCNHILPCEGKKTCSTNAELHGLDYLVADNSKGAQLYQSGSVSDPHVLCALNSISVIDFSAETDSEGKDNSGFDCASEVKCSGVFFPSSQRSPRINKSGSRNQESPVLRKCRKIINGQYHYNVDLAAKRKRSSLFRPRSSRWGLLDDIARVFEQHNGLDVIRIKSKKTRLPRVSNRGEKWKKNLASGIFQRPVEKSCPSPCRIRLKLKLRKGLDQNCLEVILPKADSLRPILASDDMPDAETRWKTDADFLESGSVDKQNVQKDDSMPKTNAYSAVLHSADNDQRSSVIMDNTTATAIDYYGVSSQLEVETSPDSEVIDTASPDAQVMPKIEEDVYYGTQTSSTGLVVNGDVISSNMVTYKGKRENELDNFAHKAKRTLVESKQSSLSKNKIRLSLNRGVGFSFEMLDSSASKNASSITSSNRKFPKESSPSLISEFGISQGAMKVEYNTEAGLDCGLDSWNRLSKLQNHDELISSSIKTKGNRSCKASKSSIIYSTKNNCTSGTSDLVGKIGEVASMQSKNLRKSGKNSKEDMGITEQVLCSLDGHLDTGNHKSPEIWNNHSPTKVASENLAYLETSILEKQFCVPRSAWVSCDDCLKWRCIPATLADTIEETKCKWTCKDNMEKAFADCSIPQEMSNEDINAELQISDASGEEDAYNTLLISKGIDKRNLNVDQNSSWTLLKSNLFLHRNRKKKIIDEIMVCQCEPPTNGLMGCGSGCLNRILNIECVRGTCPCGNLCSNQLFQKRKYAKLDLVKCGKKGYGLQSLENIRLGKFLIEYVGEVLDLPTYEARQKDYASRGHKHFYFMTLNGSEVIDASAKGNLGRFINHSCDPNCRTEKWMVNGEVCIGLFALKEIKQGEEVTFDYNYVRVFGAAAKKCVCGSPQCRGYIGGDLLKSEVIVQSDSDEEFPEPVMKIADNLLKSKDEIDVNSMGDRDSMIDIPETVTSETLLCDKEKVDKNGNDSGVRHLNAIIGTDTVVDPDFELKKSPKMEVSSGKLASIVQVQPLEVSQQIEDANNISKEKPLEDNLKKSPLSVQICDTSSLSLTVSKKSFPPCSFEYKSDTRDGKHISKLGPHMKPSRSYSSIKNEKSSKVAKPLIVAVSDAKEKSSLNASSAHVHLETVEEKLNQLLDDCGGISKRKESPRGYLKLLFLTAASDDRGKREEIQSTRDVSMILDALLKTKSRGVLVDIIGQNGLQMLHNIMKKYRMDFNKTPVLRKLLKVLEFLGVREVLTEEHINEDPPCLGMESFWDSILKLTRHDDKQVNQCARDLRDKWLIRYRRIACTDRDSTRKQQHEKRGSNRNRIPSSHNSWHEQNMRPSQPITHPFKKPLPPTAPHIPGTNNAPENLVNPRKPHKRKRRSRWSDPPTEPPKTTGSAVASGTSISLDDEKRTNNKMYSNWPFKVVSGIPQPRFRSDLPVSFGIPLITVQQFGRPASRDLDEWVFAPSTPFRPFPPLPPLPPRNTK